MTEPMDAATQAELFRKYLRGEEPGDPEDKWRRLSQLQAWHDEQGHAEADPVSGSCFCCCEACDPR